MAEGELQCLKSLCNECLRRPRRCRANLDFSECCWIRSEAQAACKRAFRGPAAQAPVSTPFRESHVLQAACLGGRQPIIYNRCIPFGLFEPVHCHEIVPSLRYAASTPSVSVASAAKRSVL